MARLRLLALMTLIGILILASTALAQGPMPLDETFTSTDGQITFNYPTGFVVGEDTATGQIRLANNDALASSEPTGLVLLPGQVYMLFITPSAIADAAALTGATIASPLDLMNVAGVILGMAVPEGVTETTIQEHPAVTTPVISDPNTGIDTFLTGIQLGDAAFMLVAVSTPTGEIDFFQATAQAILESLIFGEAPPPDATPEVTETPTEAPTEIPTEAPTNVATEAPTDVPTDVPTEVATEVPTETPTATATPTQATPTQLTLDANFLTSDGTVFFSYPSIWSVMEGPLGVPGVIALANNSALVGLDPVNVVLLPGQVYMMILAPVYMQMHLNSVSVTATTALQVANLILSEARPTTIYEQPLEISIGAYPAVLLRSSDSARGVDSLQAVIQVGEQDFFAVALDAPTGELVFVEQTALALLTTLVYNPAPVLATETPTEAAVAPTETPVEPTPVGATPEASPAATEITPPPSETVEPVATTPAAPTATPIPRPEDVSGTLRLIYNNGTLTVYNGTEDLLDLRGLEFVSPDNRVRFISRDFGAFSLTYFEPGRCIHVHLFSQAYSPPEFCPSGPVTTQLAYQSGSTDHLYFVWNASFGYTTFLVQRNGETVATCEIAAGQCTVPVPVTYLPIESLEQ